MLRVSLAVIRTSVADEVSDYTSSEAVRDARGVAFADLNEDASRIVAFFFCVGGAASGNA